MDSSHILRIRRFAALDLFWFFFGGSVKCQRFCEPSEFKQTTRFFRISRFSQRGDLNQNPKTTKNKINNSGGASVDFLWLSMLGAESIVASAEMALLFTVLTEMLIYNRDILQSVGFLKIKYKFVESNFSPIRTKIKQFIFKVSPQYAATNC